MYNVHVPVGKNDLEISDLVGGELLAAGRVWLNWCQLIAQLLESEFWFWMRQITVFVCILCHSSCLFYLEFIKTQRPKYLCGYFTTICEKKNGPWTAVHFGLDRRPRTVWRKYGPRTVAVSGPWTAVQKSLDRATLLPGPGLEIVFNTTFLCQLSGIFTTNVVFSDRSLVFLTTHVQHGPRSTVVCVAQWIRFLPAIPAARVQTPAIRRVYW